MSLSLQTNDMRLASLQLVHLNPQQPGHAVLIVYQVAYGGISGENHLQSLTAWRYVDQQHLLGQLPAGEHLPRFST